jgi:excisionase family DNA binding protein
MNASTWPSGGTWPSGAGRPAPGHVAVGPDKILDARSATKSLKHAETHKEPDNGMTPQVVEYLTSHQLGDLIQVSPRTVERWALEDATMPALRVGRTLRFPRADLLRWLERRTQGSRKSRETAGKLAPDMA